MIQTEIHNGQLAVATLDNPAALNALNHPMAIELLEHIERWQTDSNIKAILLRGAGDRAFCAGGDVKYVTRRQPGESDSDRIGRACDYFECEYRLDQTIHESTKPIIVWGDGIVMGGGMGLLQGASHRIVTERSLLSMPETAIGLYPDVGASWFLNRVTDGLGPLMGISGAHLSGADALYLNLADLMIPSELYDRMLDRLKNLEWMDTDRANQGLISYELSQIAPATQPTSDVLANRQTLLGLRDAPSLYHQVEGLKALSSHSSPWMQKLAANTAKGSPLSIAITDHHLRKHRHSSLAECFAADNRLSAKLVTGTEFPEGVRAVLIDKDHSPNWQYTDVRDIPREAYDV